MGQSTWAQKKLKIGDIQILKRRISKFSYVCGSALSEYQGTGGERESEKNILENVFVKENLSCISKVEIPYYSVDFYPRACVYCGAGGTARMLGNSTEHYPKCLSCKDKPDVLR